MHLDAIRMEAHYSALLAERGNMIVGMFNQIQELQKRVADLEQQLAEPSGDALDTMAEANADTPRKHSGRPTKPAQPEA